MCRHARKVSGLGGRSEATLFRQAQAGNRESLNLLMARHDRLVQAVVRRQVLGELPYEEAVQAGRLGLWQAIVHYDVGRGLAFSSYAWPAIMRQVWRAVKHWPRDEARRERRREDELSLGGPLEGLWEARGVQAALRDLVKRLPARLRQVVIARYGLDGQAAASYAEIGTGLGLTGERVRQLHAEALV